MPRIRLRILIAATTLIILSAIGYEKWQSAGTAIPHGSRVFQLQGTVIFTNAQRKEVTVKHNEITGYMPGMTMPFVVKDSGIAAQLKPGDLIWAKLIVTPDGRSWLQDVVFAEGQPGGNASLQAPGQLHRGEAIPDFEFINQDNRSIDLKQYKGKALLVTFIYTRCPVPTYCPLITSRFVAINNELKKDPEAYARTHLLSISFDPEHDTPVILRQYGLAYIKDPSEFKHWDFAVPAREKLPEIARYFGFQYVQEDNQIVHSLNTILIGRDGRILQNWPDNEWPKAELVDRIRKATQE